MIQILYACLLGVWRRWFGGGFDKLPDNRFLQHVIGFLACSFALWLCGYGYLQIIACAGVLQGLFWARSHGCCFDFGHGTVDVSRYDQLWYWKYVKRIIPEKMWYGYQCDFILMTIRYTIPAILMSVILFSPILSLAGLCVGVSYALCWAFYDFGLTKRPTEIAEYLSGFFTGIFLVL